MYFGQRTKESEMKSKRGPKGGSSIARKRTFEGCNLSKRALVNTINNDEEYLIGSATTLSSDFGIQKKREYPSMDAVIRSVVKGRLKKSRKIRVSVKVDSSKSLRKTKELSIENMRKHKRKMEDSDEVGGAGPALSISELQALRAQRNDVEGEGGKVKKPFQIGITRPRLRNIDEENKRNLDEKNKSRRVGKKESKLLQPKAVSYSGEESNEFYESIDDTTDDSASECWKANPVNDIRKSFSKIKKKQKVETVIAESDQKGKTRIEKTISLIPKKNKSKIFVDQIIPKKINIIPKKINSTPKKINSIPKKINSIPKKNITKFKSTKSLLYNIPKPLENGLNGNTLFKEGNRDVGNEGISSDTTMKRHDVGENKSLLSNGDMQEKMNDNWPLQKDNEVELVISQSKSSSLPEQTSNEYKIYKELNKLLEIVTAPKIYDGSSGSNINMAGTFLPQTDNEKYDFFDIDHYGEISLQPKVPMFPEDFSNQINGRQEWPLSWWGVESPPKDILAMQDDKTEVDFKSNQVLR